MTYAAGVKTRVRWSWSGSRLSALSGSPRLATSPVPGPVPGEVEFPRACAIPHRHRCGHRRTKLRREDDAEDRPLSRYGRGTAAERQGEGAAASDARRAGRAPRLDVIKNGSHAKTVEPRRNAGAFSAALRLCVRQSFPD